jgi:Flp pilus assembly protein TadG
MSDMTMQHNDGAGAGDAKGTAALAMVLWVVVILALAYGVIETFQKVVDLF